MTALELMHRLDTLLAELPSNHDLGAMIDDALTAQSPPTLTLTLEDGSAFEIRVSQTQEAYVPS